jgi:hypothetical protein
VFVVTNPAVKKPALLLGCILVLAFLCLISMNRSRPPGAGSVEQRPPSVPPSAERANVDPASAAASQSAIVSRPDSIPAATKVGIIPDGQVVAAFQEWSDAFLKASAAERAAMKAEGIALAEARRPVFKQLIQENPRQAVEQAVPMRVRQELPEEIVALLEERVSGRAALRVYQGVGLDNRSPVPTVRMAEFAEGASVACAQNSPAVVALP